MKTNDKQSERLEYYKGLYEAAAAAYTDTVERFEKSLRQYLGSDEIDGSAERAGTVRNITYELIESEISPDIPKAKVDSVCYSEEHERNARSAERLLSAVRDRLPFESMNDIDERYTYIYGGSVYYVEWDGASNENGTLGGVRVHCISPENFIPQPGISHPRDMEYCFLRFSTSRCEIISRYGVDDSELSLLESEYEFGDEISDTVSLVVCFYRGEGGEVGKLVFSGDLLLSDIPSYYRRKATVCARCGKEIDECRCKNPEEKLRTLYYEKVNIDGEDIEVPYYTPSGFPIVIRKNTSATDALFGLSDCDAIRPQQQAINKVESRILQKLLRAGVTPVMPEGATVSLGNAVFGQVIRTRPGEGLECYGKIDTTPDISQDIEEADRLYEHAKRILGISDAYLGLDTLANESGYARQLRISQANGRLEGKRRLKLLAYSELYKLIFEHYLAFADEGRELSYKDPFGKVHPAFFKRESFIERLADGEFKYSDEYLFTVDKNESAEYTSEAVWERNLQNLECGALGDKESPLTLLHYWQTQEKAHYPHARENVEYFSDIVKTIKEKEGQKNEPEL